MSGIFKSAVAAAIICSIAIAPAWADPYGRDRGDHGRHGGGFSRSAFGWGLGILAGTAVILAATNPPRTYYPPVVVERVYPQQPALASAVTFTQPQNYWYYCAQAGGYYPYVQSCPAGWMKVLPN
jgi:hypothetical protein